MVHLRRGETLRRYLRPGPGRRQDVRLLGPELQRPAASPAPNAPQTWVNQPEKMYGSRDGAGYKPGQARFANAVYTYDPDFAAGDYREGVDRRGRPPRRPSSSTRPTSSPRRRRTTPRGASTSPAARNGLVLAGKATCPVAVSIDRGKTWQDCGPLRRRPGPDRPRQGAPAVPPAVSGRAPRRWPGRGLTIITVCQANASIMPRLKDGGTTRDASPRPAGPWSRPARTCGQAAGARRRGRVRHAEGRRWSWPPRAASRWWPSTPPPTSTRGNPPDPDVRYQIEILDRRRGRPGGRWSKDWTIPRRGDEPNDFWSQSLCWGVGSTSPARDDRPGPRPVPQRRRQALRPLRGAPDLRPPPGRPDPGHLRLARRQGPP